MVQLVNSAGKSRCERTAAFHGSERLDESSPSVKRLLQFRSLRISYKALTNNCQRDTVQSVFQKRTPRVREVKALTKVTGQVTKSGPEHVAFSLAPRPKDLHIHLKKKKRKKFLLKYAMRSENDVKMIRGYAVRSTDKIRLVMSCFKRMMSK